MAFVKAIRDRSPPPVTGEDGVASLAIAIQCLDGRSDAAPDAAPDRKPAISPKPRPAPRRAQPAIAKS
jgi:UDP-N-acetylglucosamine 3-dehydrogenase